MQQEMLDRILRMSYDLRHVPDASNRHFSFIVKNNRILSMGFNDSYRTHPMGKKLGYFAESRHSELHAFIRLRNKELIPYCSLVNVRISKTGKVNIARPCKYCMPWVDGLGFKRLYYTNEQGIFVREW